MPEKNKDIIEEKLFNIPLTSAWIMPIKKRTPKAMRVLKVYIRKHMKAEEIAISSEVNEALWRRGNEGVPRHIRVRAEKTKDNKVTIYLVAR